MLEDEDWRGQREGGRGGDGARGLWVVVHTLDMNSNLIHVQISYRGLWVVVHTSGCL